MPPPTPTAAIRAFRAAAQLSRLPSRTSAPAARTCIPSTSAPRAPAHHARRHSSIRAFSSHPVSCASRPPRSRDRGPASGETTQTDFGTLDVLGGTPAPTTGIDATTSDGFALNSGLRVSGSGVLLVGGDVFRWRPWLREGRKEGTVGAGGLGNDRGRGGGTGSLRDGRGMWECDDSAWGVFEMVWPKPDLLIIGTGPTIVPVSPATRKRINDLGIRLEISDTRNAAAQFNLLATERGVQQVAAALVPIGWEEGR